MSAERSQGQNEEHTPLENPISLTSSELRETFGREPQTPQFMMLPRKGEIYEGSSLPAVLPEPLLTPSQMNRVHQYENLSRLIQTQQEYLLHNNKRALRFPHPEGMNDSVEVTQELVDRWKTNAQNLADALSTQEAGAEAVRRVQNRLIAEREEKERIAFKKNEARLAKEARKRETQEIKEAEEAEAWKSTWESVWERSNETI